MPDCAGCGMIIYSGEDAHATDGVEEHLRTGFDDEEHEWMCVCGEMHGDHCCSRCGQEPPWGCECADHVDEEDPCP